jgi:dienelactone hydrolase
MRWLPFLGVWWILCAATAGGREASTQAPQVRTLNSLREITPAHSSNEWSRTAAQIRTSIRVNCGLEPMPQRTPLHCEVLGHLDRDQYTVDIIRFQPFPGLFVGGNIYRPKGPPGRRYPGVLNPHGHWDQGRLEQTETLDAPARCVQFARMGMVALSYDMLGYQDTTQFSALNPDGSPEKTPFYNQHVALFRDPGLALWNVSLMGIQLWNSIRALDLLLEQPDVDPDRIGCTGESGGATQTFLLGAIDDRIRVAAPVNMVSHSMQGGCRCENAPGLRVQFSNLDFPAAFAPRPQLLVGATGDWTRDLLEVEAPAIRNIYSLLGATDRLRAVRFKASHNYNLSSREAVYAWFNQWLLGAAASESLPEISNPQEPRSHLQLPPDRRRPPEALTESAFIDGWLAGRRSALQTLEPRDAASLAALRTHVQQFQSTWWPEWTTDSKPNETNLPKVREWPVPNLKPLRGVVILVQPHGLGNDLFQESGPSLPALLQQEGFAVMEVEPFQTGPDRSERVVSVSPFAQFFNTYNRTLLQRRVGEVGRVCQSAQARFGTRNIVLVGPGDAGLWCLLAAPLASAVIADGSTFSPTTDTSWLTPEKFLPGLALMGGLEAGAALVVDRPLWLYSVHPQFSTDWLWRAANAAGTESRIRVDGLPPARRNLVTEWVQLATSPRR